ncbi:MAG: hypothetical protein ACXWLR_03000 [Myxococcales bacterium]
MIPLACPFCAEQAASASGTLWVLALLVVPFVVAAFALRAIRNLDG